jgi:hypothetical protein
MPPAQVVSFTNRSRTLSGSPQEERELKDLLEAEHPIYKQMKKSWSDLMNLYLGEKIETYIYRHTREKETNWKKRQERAYFFNYVQSITDLIASFIFSKSIQRNWESAATQQERVRQLRNQQLYKEYEEEQAGAQAEAEQEAKAREEARQMMEKVGKALPEKKAAAPAWGQPATPAKPPIVVQSQVEELLQSRAQDFAELTDFWRDVDLRGNSIDDYMKGIFILGQVFGHVDVFVDMPEVPDGKYVDTVQDRKDNDLRPYLFAIFPSDMVNWEVGSDGLFDWVRWKEVVTGEVGPFEKRKDKPPVKYYTWTRQEWFVHVVRYANNNNQASVALEASGQNPLGEVPVVRFYNKKNMAEPLIGQSAMKDIGKINIEILNLSSLIDEEVYQKCLNLLVMEAPANRQQAVEIGANNVLLWEGEHQPYYLAPASEPGAFMLDLIKTCVQEIYRISKLGGETGIQEAQSGIAYTWEFNQTNRMLSEKADQMERGENEVHRLWCKWMNVEWEGFVDYPDDFNVEKFDEQIKVATQLKQAVRSPEFKRLVEKKLVMRAAPKASVEERARMFAEIEVLDEEKQQFFPQF